jgi:hypothetical protein
MWRQGDGLPLALDVFLIAAPAAVLWRSSMNSARIRGGLDAIAKRLPASTEKPMTLRRDTGAARLARPHAGGKTDPIGAPD